MEIASSEDIDPEGGRSKGPIEDEEDDLLGLGLAYGLTGLAENFATNRPGAEAKDWVGAESSRYELLEELGRGGMGVVYRALDLALQREVALKVLPEGATLHRMERFRKERLIAGRLDHPAILPVYDSGVMRGGGMFLAMKLIRGETLRQLMAKPSWAEVGLPSRLSVLLRVAEAVAFAHDRGVIHRDIKPGNIMVGAFGEVLLLDWGLAADLRKTSEPVLKDSGDVVSSSGHGSTSGAGTPGYMAPEQRVGIAAEQGPWTDVYALGCLLFEILTGRQLTDKDQMGSPGTPAPGTRSQPSLESAPAELVQLLSNALVPEPLRRLPSAGRFFAHTPHCLSGQAGPGRAAWTQLAGAAGPGRR